MNISTELILGFGRTLRSVRERKNLSQKELSEGVGISVANIKKYEQENLDLIGPNGFSVSIFAKLAEYLDQHPLILFQEMISYTDLDALGDHESMVNDLAASLSEDSLKKLLKADRKAEAPFNNDLRWSLDMAAMLSELPGEAKAEIGLKILQEQVKAGLGDKDEVTKKRQDLFRYSLS